MVSIPAKLGLERNRLLIVATGAYSAGLLPMWIEAIRSWYPALEVRVVVTQGTLRFVTPTRLAITSGQPIWGPDWPEADRALVPHRELATWADAVLVFPATANAVAKIAAGIADDYAHTVIQCAACPVVIVPAVPPEVAALRVFPANVARLREYGFTVLDPAAGRSAKNGEVEVGAPAPLPDVMLALAAAVKGRATASA